jgi:transposase
MHTKITKDAFKGQEVFVGMDVHKRDFKVTVIVGGMFYKTITCPPDSKAVATYLEKNFPGATYHSAYEAGFSGFWLHKDLLQLGIDSIVVNTADIPTTDKERRQKEDRRDSRKLARDLQAGQLKGIYVPDDRALNNRSLLRVRESIVKEIRRCKQRIKSFLSFYGIRLPDEYAEARKHWSRGFIQWIESIPFAHETASKALRIHIDSLKYHRNQLLQLTRQIRNLSRSDEYKGAVEKLITVPGFGMLTSMYILTELVEITRFQNFHHLCSYVGFVPGTRSTGDRDRTTGITPRRNHRLRTALIESAWTAIRCDPALMRAFLKYTNRMEKNKAIVRIAKKLLNRAVHTLRSNEKYAKGIVK